MPPRLAAAAAAALLLAACSSSNGPTPKPSPVPTVEAPDATATAAPPTPTPAPAPASDDPIQHRWRDPASVPPGTDVFAGGILGSDDFPNYRPESTLAAVYSGRNALSFWGGEEFGSVWTGGASSGSYYSGTRAGSHRWSDTCLGVRTSLFACVETDIAASNGLIDGGDGANMYELRVAEGYPTYTAWLPERLLTVVIVSSNAEYLTLRAPFDEHAPTPVPFRAERIPGTQIQPGLGNQRATAAIVAPPGRDGTLLLSLAASQPGDIPTTDLDLAAERAAEALADWLELPEGVTRIEVVSVEPTTWPDGCRGIYRPRVGCTTVPREGVRVTLLYDRQHRYVVHTDVDGRDSTLVAETEMWVRLGACCDTSIDTLAIMDAEGLETLMPWRRIFSATAQSGMGFEAYGEPVYVRLVTDPDGEGMVVASLDHVPRRLRNKYDALGDRPNLDAIEARIGVGGAAGMVQTLPPTKTNLPAVGLSLWGDVLHAIVYWGDGIIATSSLGAQRNAGFGDPVAQTWPDSCIGVSSPGLECVPGEVVAYEQLVYAGDRQSPVYRFRVSEAIPVAVAWLADEVIEAELVSIRRVDDRQSEVTLRSETGRLTVALTSVEAQIAEGLEAGDRVRAGLVPRAVSGDPQWGVLSLDRIED